MWLKASSLEFRNREARVHCSGTLSPEFGTEPRALEYCPFPPLRQECDNLLLLLEHFVNACFNLVAEVFFRVCFKNWKNSYTEILAAYEDCKSNTQQVGNIDITITCTILNYFCACKLWYSYTQMIAKCLSI